MGIFRFVFFLLSCDYEFTSARWARRYWFRVSHIARAIDSAELCRLKCRPAHSIPMCVLSLNCSHKWVTSNSFAILLKKNSRNTKTLLRHVDVVHHTLPVPRTLLFVVCFIMIFIRLRFLCVRRCADTSINLINVHADKSNTIKINHFLIQCVRPPLSLVHNLIVYAARARQQPQQSILISNRITHRFHAHFVLIDLYCELTKLLLTFRFFSIQINHFVCDLWSL